MSFYSMASIALGNLRNLVFFIISSLKIFKKCLLKLLIKIILNIFINYKVVGILLDILKMFPIIYQYSNTISNKISEHKLSNLFLIVNSITDVPHSSTSPPSHCLHPHCSSQPFITLLSMSMGHAYTKQGSYMIKSSEFNHSSCAMLRLTAVLKDVYHLLSQLTMLSSG